MAKRQLKTYRFIIGIVVAFLIISYTSYIQGLWRFNYPSSEQCRTQGLDISHHQNIINWPSIDKTKYKFVYIKATEGGDYHDPNFVENWDSAHENNFNRGAYHFFTLCRDGAEQAKNFIAIVPLQSGSLPPAIDLEYVGNCSSRPDKELFLKNLNVFSSALEKKYGQQPLIYTTDHFFSDYLRDTKYASYPLWIRNVFKYPSTKIFPSWKIWQFADNAHITGITGPVDLNCSN